MKETLAINEILGYTTTTARRRAFFNFSTLVYCTGEATFFLLVNEFRKTGKKRQAIFLKEAYLEEKDFGVAVNTFVAGGLNIKGAAFDRKAFGKSVIDQVDSVGRTSIDKIKRGGLVNFIGGKLGRDATGIHPDIFDELLDMAAVDLSGNMGANQQIYGSAGKFKPNGSYQPNPKFQQHLPAFRTKLEALKFDTASLGIF